MKIFFTALRSRGQAVYDGWKKLVTSANAIWEEVLHDENLERYFVAKNITVFLQNYTIVAEVSDPEIHCTNIARNVVFVSNFPYFTDF